MNDWSMLAGNPRGPSLLFLSQMSGRRSWLQCKAQVEALHVCLISVNCGAAERIRDQCVTEQHTGSNQTHLPIACARAPQCSWHQEPGSGTTCPPHQGLCHRKWLCVHKKYLSRTLIKHVFLPGLVKELMNWLCSLTSMETDEQKACSRGKKKKKKKAPNWPLGGARALPMRPQLAYGPFREILEMNLKHPRISNQHWTLEII